MNAVVLKAVATEAPRGVVAELGVCLDRFAAALAGEPGDKLRRYDGAGPLASLIRSVLELLTGALEALAAGMVKVEAWTRLADATLALVELLAESIGATTSAGAALVGTRGRLSDTATDLAHPLLDNLSASGDSLRSLGELASGAIGERLPALADIAAVRTRLATLLSEETGPESQTSPTPGEAAADDATTRSLVALTRAIARADERAANATAETPALRRSDDKQRPTAARQGATTK